MRRRWSRTGSGLASIEDVPIPKLGEAEVCVRLSHQVIGPQDCGGVPAGIGVVESSGPDAENLVARRVLVPAVVPRTEERDAALVPLSQPDADGVCLWSHLICPARWVLPLEDGLELGPLGALVGRELGDAYALMIDANTLPRARVLVVGSGPRAELARQVVATRQIEAVLVDQPGADVAESLKHRNDERLYILVADADAALCNRASELIASLWRPSIAVMNGVEGGSIELAAVARAGARIVGVIGAHPDLLAETAALVQKEKVDLSRVAEVVTIDQQLGDGVYVVELPD